VSKLTPKPCAHDPRAYINTSIGTDLRTGEQRFLLFNRYCPLFALSGGKFCIPHSILHDAIPPEHEKRVLGWHGKSIQWFSNGWLIQPLTPEGMPVLPGWWPHRFN
jgi:hypothetical protein